MLPCEKTRSTNGDVAGTPKRRENSGLRPTKSSDSSQSSRFLAEMYFDSSTSGRALVVELAASKARLFWFVFKVSMKQNRLHLSVMLHYFLPVPYYYYWLLSASQFIFIQELLC